jgi:8-oxo-dGTP pyrophosphatase MutT (NUDIX family)
VARKGTKRKGGPAGRAGGPGRRQYAALPLATGEDGRRLVMLVTSRGTRRWVIPKGNPEKGLAPHALAAKEAYEEAGLVGVVGPEPVGAFRYAKRLGGRKVVPVEVEVFPLAVERELADWPERGQRERRWFAPGEAALLVEEGGLVEILLALAAAEG